LVAVIFVKLLMDEKEEISNWMVDALLYPLAPLMNFDLPVIRTLINT
jgi:hypothetical protein